MTITARCQQTLRVCLDTLAVRGREASLQPGRIVVGFSGGLDSTVLLHAAKAVAAQPLVAVHVNHASHESSDAWQVHCEAVCRSMAVPLITRKLQLARARVGEARLRAGRYAVYSDIVREGDVLLLAHHADDLAESVLLHVLQGRGAYGMPRQRLLGAGVLLRPLLDLRQAELAAYAEKENLTWVEDSSNLDTRFDRNFLRRDVLPQLETRFSNLTGRLARVASQTVELQALAARGTDLAGPTLPTSVLLGMEPDVSARLLRFWLTRQIEAPAGATSQAALAEFIRQLDCPDSRQPRLDLPRGSLRRHRGEVFYVPSGPALTDARAAPALPRDAAPFTLVLDHGVLTVREGGDGARSLGQLHLVYRQAGARLLVNGHHRSVKQMLREAGLPPWERDNYPLLADDAGLLIIPGIAARDDAELDNAPAPHEQPSIERRLSARWTPSRLVPDGDH